VRREQKVYSIIHPDRRNLTAIRGYRRIGGLPDDPHTDPQDRTWCTSHLACHPIGLALSRHS
jgi:alpha-1,3-mannosyltransferase